MKKINSELKFPNDLFKIKIGTTNKKKPDTVYVEMGTYLTPTFEKDSYSEDFENINKEAKQKVKSILTSSGEFDNNFIFINDIATDRVIPGKKSYFEIQLYLKPLMLNMYGKPFKYIAEKINTDYLSNFIPYIENNVMEKGYIMSKMKN